MLKVDVYVRRLVAFPTDEPLEQEIGTAGVNGSDTQAVTDGGVRCRTAALAEDVALVARVHDDVVHGEKIRGVVLVGDQAQLVPDRLLDLVGHALRIALGGADPGQPLQCLLRCLAIADGLGRIIVAQLVEREADTIQQHLGLLQVIGVFGKQPRHFTRRLEVTFGIGLQTAAGGGQSQVFADAGDDILHDAAAGLVIEHIVDRNQGQPERSCDMRQPVEPGAVVAQESRRGSKPDAVGSDLVQLREPFR